MTNDTQVMLGHGSGGIMMKRIIDEVFFEAYGNTTLGTGDDAAVLPELAPGERLAFSTDSFVVTPQIFPGADIGRLAVCGTVNDVATSGATPRYLSVGMILEEGFPMEDLRRICTSMAKAAEEAGVRIVTGDTKVVNRGHGDGVYINTSGVGVLAPNVNLSGANCQPGDAVLVSGTLGDHGITIMSQREGLGFSADIESDAAPLNHLIAEVLAAAPTGSVRCFRDPTRGGLASTLNELAEQSQVDITINEPNVPVKPAVLGACEMLGYDVLQVANEGKMVCVVAPEAADAALEAMRANKYGKDAAIIGEVSAVPAAPGEVSAVPAVPGISGTSGTTNVPDAPTASAASGTPGMPAASAASGTPGVSGTSAESGRSSKVFLRTAFGSTRILDMLVGEQLPRIC